MPKAAPSPKKTKGKKCREVRFMHIHEDAPLTEMESLFVYEYLKDPNDKKGAAIRAGYSEKSAQTRATELIHYKPNTKKAIANRLARVHERLDFGVYDILRRLGHIAFGDVTDICEWEQGLLRIKDSAELPKEARALIASVEEKINERGDRSLKVNTRDSLAAIKMLSQYYRLLTPDGAAPRSPLSEQADAIRDVRDGRRTVIEAALDLDAQGIPLPETLRIMLNRWTPPEESPDEGDSQLPTPEEMAAKRQAKLAEIEQQKTEFLPERQEDVRQIKAELGDKAKAFAPDANPGARDGDKS